MFSNIYFYASELNSARPRLEKHSEFASLAGEQGTATIVRAVHEGNWKPEPLAMNVFATWLRHKRKFNVTIDDQPLAKIGELDHRPFRPFLATATCAGLKM